MFDVGTRDGEWVDLGDFLAAADHLQMLSMRLETGTLELTSGECCGALYLRQGDVVEADCAGRSITGMEASVCLLCLRDAKCRYRKGEHSKARVIHESTPALLLEAARWFDENRRICPRERVREEASSLGWVLLIDSGPEGRAVPLGEGTLVIGRGEACHVAILQRSISRRHAEIETSGRKVILRDLGSTNGTFVNGRPIREQAIALDDQMLFGDVAARLVTQAEAMTQRKTELLPIPAVVTYADTRNIRSDHPTARKERAA